MYTNAYPRYYHLSIDDVFEAFIQASQSQRPPATHPFFAFLTELHSNFKVHVDLYLFQRKTQDGVMRSLNLITPQVSRWLHENPWVRLGPHALDPETPPYQQGVQEQRETIRQIYDQIERLVRPHQYSRWVRLHWFSESYELAADFAKHGVEALLTTDKPAVSYRLDARNRSILRQTGSIQYAGIRLIRSHLRVEDFLAKRSHRQPLDQMLSYFRPNVGCFVVFTHEYELIRPEIQSTLREILSLLAAIGAVPQQRCLP
jgi:hypothetical protein